MSTNVTLLPKELARLRAFQRQAAWIRKSKLLSTPTVRFKSNTTYSVDSKTWTRSFEGFDETEFLAVLPVLRQFVLEQEPVSFFSIHNIIMKNCDREEPKQWVKYARQLWKDTLSGIPSGNVIFFKDLPSVGEAIEQSFYGFGGLFHIELEKPELDENAQIVILAAVQKSFLPLWHAVNLVDSVIHAWLDDPSLNIPPFVASQASSSSLLGETDE